MQFAAGYLTGVLVLAVILILDLPWWAAIPLATITYGLSSGIAKRLQEIRDRK